MFVRQEAFDIKVLNDFSESSKSYKSRNRRFRNEAERAVAWNLQVFTYDHKGRMIRKTISRGDAEPQSITYLWDGWNIVREELRTPHSQLRTTHNLWGLDLDGTMQGAGGVGGLLAVVRDGETYLPTYDANGNISEYVSAADGTVAAHYDYSPFGETLIASGPLASSFTHRFSTRPYCQTTGFCEYQMRKYRPDIGRWMSRDPMGEFSEANLYKFCHDVYGEYDMLGTTKVEIDMSVQNEQDPSDYSYKQYMMIAVTIIEPPDENGFINFIQLKKSDGIWKIDSYNKQYPYYYSSIELANAKTRNESDQTVYSLFDKPGKSPEVVEFMTAVVETKRTCKRDNTVFRSLHCYDTIEIIEIKHWAANPDGTYNLNTGEITEVGKNIQIFRGILKSNAWDIPFLCPVLILEIK